MFIFFMCMSQKYVSCLINKIVYTLTHTHIANVFVKYFHRKDYDFLYLTPDGLFYLESDTS